MHFLWNFVFIFKYYYVNVAPIRKLLKNLLKTEKKNYIGFHNSLLNKILMPLDILQIPTKNIKQSKNGKRSIRNWTLRSIFWVTWSTELDHKRALSFATENVKCRNQSTYLTEFCFWFIFTWQKVINFHRVNQVKICPYGPYLHYMQSHNRKWW